MYLFLYEACIGHKLLVGVKRVKKIEISILVSW